MPALRQPLSADVTYEALTPSSAAAHQRAEGWIPGGVSRQTLAFPPYPMYAETAAGASIVDLDGNRYLDFANNYTSLIHGHGFAPVMEAVSAALAVASVGAPHPLEGTYASLLCGRLPALERVHFCTTGSEAVMYAVRVARAATGRPRVLTFEGGFHGSANELARDVSNEALAPGSCVPARAASAGLEPTTGLTGVYNDLASVDVAFERWGTEIAAVVFEPFLGNSALIPASPDFVAHIAAVARHYGALVILDEVQGLRLGFSGSHGLDGATPDLLAIGKIMGGGLPLAAYGGRADLMAILDGAAPPLVQTGTFTAMPAALAAGYAAMTHLSRADFDRLDALGAEVRQDLRDELAAAAITGTVNGRGSMFNISINPTPVTSYRVHRQSDRTLWTAVYQQLLAHGVLLMPRGTGCLSTAHTRDHLDGLRSAFRDSLRTVLQ